MLLQDLIFLKKKVREKHSVTQERKMTCNTLNQYLN